MKDGCFTKQVANSLIGVNDRGYFGLDFLKADKISMTLHTKDKFYSELIGINNTMVYDFQINEKNQLEEHIFHSPKILDDSSSAYKLSKTLIQLGILKVKDLVFKRGLKGYNRKVCDLIQEMKTRLPKTQDRQPEQAGKENSILYLSLEGKQKPSCDILMKQIYIELQSRVSINTPYKKKWGKMLNEQNIDWVEIWNTVHQTTTTLKIKFDIFSQIRLSFYCNYIHQKSDSNVTAMCNLRGGEMKHTVMKSCLAKQCFIHRTF